MNVNEEAYAALQAENALLRQRIAALEQQVETLTGRLNTSTPQNCNSTRDHHNAEEKDENGRIFRRTSAPVLSSIPYVRVFECLPIPVVIFRADGVVAAINQQNVALLQTASDELVGRFNMFEDREALEKGYCEHFLRACAGEVAQMPPTSYNTLNAGITGRQHAPVIWTETTYFPIATHDGTIGYVGEMSRDITAWMQTASELQQREERMDIMLQTMPVMVAALDKDDQVIVWNNECERVTGYRADEVPDKATLLERLYPDPFYRAEVHERILRNAFLNREGDWIITCKDGSKKMTIWSSVSRLSYQPEWASFVIGFDVTEHRHMEQEVRTLSALVEHAPDGIALIAPNGHIIYLNPALQAMIGCADITGLVVTDLFAEAPETVMAMFNHTLYHGTWNGTLTCKSYNGRTFKGHLASLTIPHTSDTPQTIGWIIRDITQHLELETALRTAQEQLERQVEERTRELFQTNQVLQAEIAEHLWTETLLFQREALNRTILDAMPVLISYLDTNLRYQFANKAYEHWFGFSRDEIPRKHIAEVIGTTSYQRLQEYVTRALAGHHVTHEFLMPTSNQGERYVASSYIPHINEHDEVLGVFVMIQDMSEQKQMEAALRQSEGRYRAISELITDFAYSLRIEDGGAMSLEWMTEASWRITGFLPEEVERIGGWRRIVHPQDLPLIMQVYSKVVSGTPDVSEFRIIARSGEIRWLRSHTQPVWDEREGRVVRIYGGAKDITERKQAEERIQQQVKRLSALRQIDMAITANLDLSLTLNVLLNQVTTHLEVDAAAVLLLNAHTHTLEFAAGRGFHSFEVEQISLHVPKQDDQHIIPNLDRTTLLESEGFNTYYSVPLVAKGQIKGVLEIFQYAARTPTREWLNFLGMLAGQAAIAMDNAELFEHLQRSKEELVRAYDETIEGWARALEMRDAETEGHSRRVTEMTVKLAQMLGCSDDDLVHIRRGAILHDIGKMAIPDTILLKPGKLTDAEWETMRQHPVYAYKWLTPISYLKPALDIPYHHHERWDGSGYPLGLRGAEIPLAARIFAVVDVWDALRSDRPYRSGWPDDEVFAYIREQAGTAFDPQVVDTFLQFHARG
jgi:PAS domain S-box-containing protein